MRISVWAGTLLAMSVAGSISAQVLDLPTGRTADLSNDPQVSAEAGLALGDANYFGTRGNVRLAERLLIGVDAGIADYGDREFAAGLSALYQFAVPAPVAVAVKAGGDTTLTGEGDVTDLSVEGIVSGPIVQGLQWYANAGLHFVQVEDAGMGEVHIMVVGRGSRRLHSEDDDVVPALGAGLTFAFDKNASAFVGADMLLGDLYDDNVIGAGFRWSFD